MNKNKSLSRTANHSFGRRLVADGITLSNDSQFTNLNLNDCVIGSTSSGKTGSYVAPNLVFPSYGSYVISDTKGQLLKKYGPHLRKLGYVVKTIDLVNPEKSGGYNPLQFIRRHEDGRIHEKDVKSLANTICPVQSDRDPFWEQAAARYITVLISYVLESLPRSEQTMTSVATLHKAYLSGPGKAEIDEWCADNPDSLCAKKHSEMSSIGDAEKTRACIIEFANNALDIFCYSEYAPIFEKSRCFDFRMLGRQKTALFLVTSDNDSSYDRLTNILHQQLFQTLIDEADHQPEGHLAVPCRIILDDFAASAKIPEFARLITIIRSRGICTTLLLQSKTQLDSLYGMHDASTIIANCDTMLYFGGNDTETAQFISKHLNRSLQTVLTLDRSKAVLIVHGERARIVDKIPPYSITPKDYYSAAESEKEVDYEK